MKKRPVRQTHMIVATMISMLSDGPVTVAEMAAETGLSEQSTRTYIRAMRRVCVVYVSLWELDDRGRQTLAGYSLGTKPDVVRVPPRSRKEICRDYRARRKTAMMLGVRA